ncbi:MAG: response regulator [candidate division Zixibacteria bacterium]|nr:response regulator [candidate division Zixibacteria bacterium]MDH3939293.1 response regulator [candidate division Zixibacteria bacterium]MDH4032723.1 response regulator [candidate division Zixibacteria bacterium]
MALKILVVDDSPTVVKFVSFSLKKSGYEVVTACDGMDAIEKISNLTEQISLVITDLNMPNLDGYGLIEALRQNPEHVGTPIIILSSEDGEEDRKKGIEVGASSYLVKPFKASVLIDEVSRYLNQEEKVS